MEGGEEAVREVKSLPWGFSTRECVAVSSPVGKDGKSSTLKFSYLSHK